MRVKEQRRKSILGWRNSMCKGSEMRRSTAHWAPERRQCGWEPDSKRKGVVRWEERHKDEPVGESLVSHVEELDYSPKSDGNLQKATTHWKWCRQIHILLDDHPSFSVKNGLDIPGVGVEGNFICIPGKCLWIYSHNSRHLAWLAVLLPVILPLESQMPLHAYCLQVTNPFSILTSTSWYRKALSHQRRRKH